MGPFVNFGLAEPVSKEGMCDGQLKSKRTLIC